MKKGLMILAALLVIASGIMAVGAYEGHLVDVKAHVENAIGVQTYEFDFGTVFPEDYIEGSIMIGLSNSFVEQDTYSSVYYDLWWEPKPIGQHVAVDPDGDGYFEPIAPYITVEVDSSAPGAIGAGRIASVLAKWDGPAGTAIVPIGIGSLSWDNEDVCDKIHMNFTVPTFDNTYNKYTDPMLDVALLKLADKDYQVDTETIECSATSSFNAQVPHADLGNNLKIQVTGFRLHTEGDK